MTQDLYNDDPLDQDHAQRCDELLSESHRCSYHNPDRCSCLLPGQGCDDNDILEGRPFLFCDGLSSTCRNIYDHKKDPGLQIDKTYVDTIEFRIEYRGPVLHWTYLTDHILLNKNVGDVELDEKD